MKINIRFLKVELKRILKTRLTLILLSAALLLSFIMAWLPTTFSYNSYTDAQGRTVELQGLASIAYEKELQADIAGTVTPEKVRQVVEDYQTCLARYGAETSYDLPTAFTRPKSCPMPRCCTGSGKFLPIPVPALHRPFWKLIPKKWTIITICVASVSYL